MQQKEVPRLGTVHEKNEKQQLMKQFAAEIKFWYQQRNLGKVQSLVRSNIVPLVAPDKRKSSYAIQSENIQFLLILFQYLPRSAFNICIQNVFRNLPKSEHQRNEHFIDHVSDFLLNLSTTTTLTADTVNILLSDSIYNRMDIQRADKLFQLFFLQQSNNDGEFNSTTNFSPLLMSSNNQSNSRPRVAASVRSINIMMEAHRRAAETTNPNPNFNSQQNKPPPTSLPTDSSNYNFRMMKYYYSLFQTLLPRSQQQTMEVVTLP